MATSSLAQEATPPTIEFTSDDLLAAMIEAAEEARGEGPAQAVCDVLLDPTCVAADLAALPGCDPYIDAGCNPVDPEEPPLGCTGCIPGDPAWTEVLDLLRPPAFDPASPEATVLVPQFPADLMIGGEPILLAPN